MAGETVKLDRALTLEIVECCSCHIEFGVPTRWVADRRADHVWWFCPNGHQQHYTAETEAEQLKRELEKTKGWLASERQSYAALSSDLKAERRQHAATKGQLTKTRNRIASGQCPHCGKRFSKLEHHMVTAHTSEVGAARDALLEEVSGGAS